MLTEDIFVQTFLPVLVGVLASFLLWFGGQCLVGYLREKTAKVAMLQEIEEAIETNMDILDLLVRGMPKSLARQEIPIHIRCRMRLEVFQYIVQSGEIRLVTDIHKQTLIRHAAYVCSTFNDFIDNTAVVLAKMIGEPKASKIAHQRLNGFVKQAEDEKKVLSIMLKELQGEALANENRDKS